MRILIIILFSFLSLSTIAQDNVKRVAILKAVDEVGDVPVGVKLNLRSTLAYAISHMQGYEAYTRVNISEIMDEQSFQRTGYVSDAQIKKLGEMTGASYVLVAEAAYYDENNIVVTATIIDVETARIVESSQPEIAPTEPTAMRESCIRIARTLLGKGQGGGNSVSSSSSSSTSAPQRGQNFTETAFGINMRMVYVEGGTFTMGCTSEQSNCWDDESPTRRTTVGSFYIGMLEVTQSQWEKVMGTTIYQQRDKARGSDMKGTGAEYPMYYISWNEAKEFCARLSQQTGRNYRLPTEAEWEYAARGGNKNEGTKFSGGRTIGDVAWYDGNSGRSAHPCGTKRANALGIYDMSGNVYEWCEDWLGPYLGYDTDNPRGASSGTGRVLRGGGWRDGAASCRVSNRCSDSPGSRSYVYGFRVVLAP